MASDPTHLVPHVLHTDDGSNGTRKVKKLVCDTCRKAHSQFCEGTNPCSRCKRCELDCTLPKETSPENSTTNETHQTCHTFIATSPSPYGATPPLARHTSRIEPNPYSIVRENCLARKYRVFGEINYYRSLITKAAENPQSVLSFLQRWDAEMCLAKIKDEPERLDSLDRGLYCLERLESLACYDEAERRKFVMASLDTEAKRRELLAAALYASGVQPLDLEEPTHDAWPKSFRGNSVEPCRSPARSYNPTSPAHVGEAYSRPAYATSYASSSSAVQSSSTIQDSSWKGLQGEGFTRPSCLRTQHPNTFGTHPGTPTYNDPEAIVKTSLPEQSSVAHKPPMTLNSFLGTPQNTDTEHVMAHLNRFDRHIHNQVKVPFDIVLEDGEGSQAVWNSWTPPTLTLGNDGGGPGTMIDRHSQLHWDNTESVGPQGPPILESSGDGSGIIIDHDQPHWENTIGGGGQFVLDLYSGPILGNGGDGPQITADHHSNHHWENINGGDDFHGPLSPVDSDGGPQIIFDPSGPPHWENTNDGATQAVVHLHAPSILENSGGGDHRPWSVSLGPY
ncbi:uncharacterized protein EI90DRAFT_3119153 [Cantharellus anzutake]|uniref:uncharacterized protein n=1 Tax=Cantharellus anzutake TaxID=1750568 RepID=UPI001908B31E|nr:uncharacterized protein EI90DRAFT_3119153 [Cantharellus anzutake]KAF8336815.1 hypothetical protein EI90DRAFT_3119153 [Cantharellus anzutake]